MIFGAQGAAAPVVQHTTKDDASQAWKAAVSGAGSAVQPSISHSSFNLNFSDLWDHFAQESADNAHKVAVNAANAIVENRKNFEVTWSACEFVVAAAAAIIPGGAALLPYIIPAGEIAKQGIIEAAYALDGDDNTNRGDQDRAFGWGTAAVSRVLGIAGGLWGNSIMSSQVAGAGATVSSLLGQATRRITAEAVLAKTFSARGLMAIAGAASGGVQAYGRGEEWYGVLYHGAMSGLTMAATNRVFFV